MDDSEKYAALIAEDRELSAQEGREPVYPETPTGPVEANAEPMDDHVRGFVERHVGSSQEEPPEQPPQQRQDDGIADVFEDPLAHFTARTDRLEQHAYQQHQAAAERQVWDNVKASEDRARAEIGDDYDNAIVHLEQGRMAEYERMFPDNSAQAAAFAHQYGLPSPAHLRAALLNRDRLMVTDYAMRNGLDPATYYHRLAIERGYRPKVAMTRSQRKQLSHAMGTAQGDDFDKLWSVYEKGARLEDEMARR